MGAGAQFLRGGRTTSGCFFVFQSSFIVSFTNTPVTGTSADISVMAGLLSYSRYLQSVAAAVQYWRPFTASEVQLPDQPPFCSRGTNRLLLLVEQLAEQFLSWWENNFWVFLRVSFSVSFTINTPVTGHLSRYATTPKMKPPAGAVATSS